MPPMMQGIIIALLISLLVGILIGFSLRQGRVTALTKSLKDSRDRQETQARDHEERLRTATEQLQRDYERQIAEKSERYQRQYDEQVQRLEAEYQARQGAVLDGEIPAGFDPENPQGLADLGTVPVSDAEQQIRKQYEARLKDIAYKIQQAYEQHLREKLSEARDAYQAEYDQRLAQALERYQDEAEARLAEALRDRDLQVAALGMDAAPGTSGDDNDTLVQERVAALEVQLRAEYDRRLAERIEQYQDDMTQRTAQLEQEFAARLQMAQQSAQPVGLPTPSPITEGTPSELEARLQAQYDQQLAEVIARHQDELVRRTEALEADFAARLYVAQQGGAMGESPVSELGQPLSLAMSGSDHSSTWHPGLDTPAWEAEDTTAPTAGEPSLDSPAPSPMPEEAIGAQSEPTTPEILLLPDPDPLMDTASAAERLEEGQLDMDPFTDLDDALGRDNDIASGMALRDSDLLASDLQALQPDGSEEDWSADPLDLTAIELPGIERLSPTEPELDDDADLDAFEADLNETDLNIDADLNQDLDINDLAIEPDATDLNASEDSEADDPFRDELPLDGSPLDGSPLDNDLDTEALDALMATTIDDGDTSAEDDEFFDRLDDDLRNLG